MRNGARRNGARRNTKLSPRDVDLVVGLVLAGYSQERVGAWLASNGKGVSANYLYKVATGRARVRGDRVVIVPPQGRRGLDEIRLMIEAAERRAEKLLEEAALAQASVNRLRSRLALAEMEAAR